MTPSFENRRVRSRRFYAIIFPYFRGGASLSRLTENAAKQSSGETWKISKVDDTDAEVSAHARVPLSVFQLGLSRASSEIGERPFPFFDDCDDGGCV